MLRTYRELLNSSGSSSGSVKQDKPAISYSVDKALDTILQKSDVNFRISFNQDGTMRSLKNLIRRYPKNRALLEFKNQLAHFYQAILSGDFDTFSMLYPAFSRYIKTRTGIAAQPLEIFIFNLLNPISSQLTLQQRLLLQGVMNESFSVFPITTISKAQYYSVNQAWIGLLEDGKRHHATPEMIIKTHGLLQHYFNTTAPIDSELNTIINRLALTMNTLFNFVHSPKQINQLKKLINQFPYLKTQLTTEHKDKLCLPGTDMAQVVDYCSREELAALNEFYFELKEMQFPSFQAALTDLLALSGDAQQPWFIKSVIGDLQASLDKVMRPGYQNKLFILEEYAADEWGELFSKMRFDCKKIFENHPKSQVSERLTSERFFDNLLLKLNAYHTQTPTLAANIQDIEALRVENRAWVNFIETALEPPKETLVLVEYQKLKAFFKNTSLPIEYSDEFEGLLEQGMSLRLIWERIGVNSAPLGNAVLRMHTLIMKHPKFCSNPEDQPFITWIKRNRDELGHSVERSLRHYCTSAQSMSVNIHADEKTIQSVRQILRQLSHARALLVTEFREINDNIIGKESLEVFNRLSGQLNTTIKYLLEEKRRVISTVEGARDWQLLPPFSVFLEPVQLALASLLTDKNYHQLLLKYYPNDFEELSSTLQETWVAIKSAIDSLYSDEQLNDLWQHLDATTLSPILQNAPKTASREKEVHPPIGDKETGSVQNASVCRQLFFSNALSSAPLFVGTKNSIVETLPWVGRK